jgi:hypothetical protein
MMLSITLARKMNVLVKVYLLAPQLIIQSIYEIVVAAVVKIVPILLPIIMKKSIQLLKHVILQQLLLIRGIMMILVAVNQKAIKLY